MKATSLRLCHADRSKSPKSIPFPSQEKHPYATSSTTPPASVIFRSASLLNHLARTTNGISGILPFPRTFEYPRGRRSRTGTVSFLLPERYSSRFSAGTRDQSCVGSQYKPVNCTIISSNCPPIILPRLVVLPINCIQQNLHPMDGPRLQEEIVTTHLIKVDNWLPEVISLLMEVSHSDLSKVTRMVLIHVCSVMMLSTSKTSTTGMLAVLAYTTVTGGNVSATRRRRYRQLNSSSAVLNSFPVHPTRPPFKISSTFDFVAQGRGWRD